MDVPEVLEHWVPVPLLAMGFWFLLRRTFKDFEDRLASLFKHMEVVLKEQNSHNTQLQLLELRLSQLEKRRRR